MRKVWTTFLGNRALHWPRDELVSKPGLSVTLHAAKTNPGTLCFRPQRSLGSWGGRNGGALGVRRVTAGGSAEAPIAARGARAARLGDLTGHVRSRAGLSEGPANRLCSRWA